MVITDKVVTQNGADFTFVCGKVPFAVSCSTNLPHKDFNMIDLDLINKMKIPLKKKSYFMGIIPILGIIQRTYLRLVEY